MSRDHKRAVPRGAARSGSGRRSGTHPLLTGFVLGVFAGMGISVGVVYIVNERVLLATPRGEGIASNPPIPAELNASAAEGVTVTASGAPFVKEAATVGEKTKFDFFDILPGESAQAPPERSESLSKLASSAKEVPAEPKENSPERLWLQSGSFLQPADADKMKAELALQGVEAYIRTKAVPEKGTWHRVLIGPYSTSEEAERVRALLRQNGFDTPLLLIRSSARNAAPPD